MRKLFVAVITFLSISSCRTFEETHEEINNNLQLNSYAAEMNKQSIDSMSVKQIDNSIIVDEDPKSPPRK